MMMQETVTNHELVSALADGQLRGEEFARTLQLLGQAHEARLTWHAYHLVGDVLRSGESMVSARDNDFLARLRIGLQQEVPLVPAVHATDSIAEYAMPTVDKGINDSKNSAANDASFRWKMLAGIASLAVVSVIGWHGLSGTGDQHGAPQFAQLPLQTVKPEAVSQPLVDGAEPQVMIRDPQLDALLAAHKQFGGTSAFQVPTGFLRNATFEGAAR